ncbi:MAG TPA: RNA methyltransferase [Candidatus Acidoferrales bacterium]
MPASRTSTACTTPARLETVTSRDNRWLKQFRAALGGERLDDGWIGVEGPHLVEEALRADLPVRAVLVSSGGEALLEQLPPLPEDARLLKTSDKLFASVADTRTPQGVAALVRPREWRLDEMTGGAPLLVVLVGVQDPGNVGTIVRSVEAFGGTGVVATSGAADPFSPKALRASAGSALRVPIFAAAAPAVLLAQLRMAGLRTLAADIREGIDPAEANLAEPCALLIGSEGAGLPPEIARSADARVRIPIAAGVDSLNAAVAAAVLLYEASRQRRS